MAAVCNYVHCTNTINANKRRWLLVLAPTRADSNWWIWFPSKTETFRPPNTRFLSLFSFTREWFGCNVFFFFVYIIALRFGINSFSCVNLFCLVFAVCRWKRNRAFFVCFFACFFLAKHIMIWYESQIAEKKKLQIKLIEKRTETIVDIDALK